MGSFPYMNVRRSLTMAVGSKSSLERVRKHLQAATEERKFSARVDNMSEIHDQLMISNDLRRFCELNV